MPSRIDEAGQSRSTGGKAEMFSSAGGTRTDNTSVRSRTCLSVWLSEWVSQCMGEWVGG